MMIVMKRTQIYHLVVLIFLGIFSVGFITPDALQAQIFGQNKVNYENFNWSFIRSENFDVYYYGDNKDLAVYTAETAERALVQVDEELNWHITERIAIIVYESHNNFQQTNVTTQYLPEGVGGFTELFKNRIVVPYEGDYEQFRHVIHHELTHAVMNDFLYGGSLQSIVSGRVTVQLPLWMSEGYAEHSSLYWDTKADMTIRDLAVNVQIPDLNQLNGYLAYKGGQGVMRYIADTYGKKKVGEVFTQIKRNHSVEQGVRAALGGDFENLNRRWRKYIREQYWPDIEGREDIVDIGTQLTDHDELRNYYNIAPAISPDGGRIAILSDRDGYADIFLISAIDGREIKKVISGGRTPDFEELKWLQSGITWSPDGEKIALTSKIGPRDALNIIDVNTGEKKSFTFKTVENLFTAEWSPDGKKIAMVGHQNRQSDIYVYNLETKDLRNITDDIYSDSEPRWSPEGDRIMFISDRGDNLQAGVNAMYQYDYTNKDIYIYHLEDESIERVTDSPYEENYPAWAHTENKIAYTSDRSGIHNVYLHDLETGENYAVTNILTGIQQLSWSGDDSKLVFSGYKEMGWDIYILTNPLKIEPGSVNPPRTKFRKLEQDEGLPPVYSIPGQAPEQFADLQLEPQQPTSKTEDEQGGSYSSYVFAPWHNPDMEMTSAPDSQAVFPEDTLESKDESGDYVAHNYKTKFTLDLINSQAYYNTFFGFQGSTIFMFSDILGDHRFLLATDMYVDLQNSSYFLTYEYLKRQTNYGLTIFNSPNFFRHYFYGLIRYRNYGGVFTVSRPFNKFSRIDFNALYYNVEMKTLDIPNDPLYVEAGLYRHELIQTVLPSLSYVYDNTIFGYTGPMDGLRFNVTYTHSPKYNKNSLDFQTAEFDIRKYWMLNQNFTAATRLTAGISEGENAQRFFMGGVSNWLNRRFAGGLDTYIGDPENIYFSKFVTPVRGSRYYEQFGTRYFLLNSEFRFPFIQYLIMRFPLPMFFQNVRGAVFWDSGAAWTNGDLNILRTDQFGRRVFDDMIAGYGYGFRIFFGYFLLKIDVAWELESFHIFRDASKPKYYFSIGADF